ncbi:MAG: EutN/CcmL family microcompartment protein [Chloroflexota bacterium]
MKLGRVVGTVTSTINVPVYDDRKLLLCDLVAPDGSPVDGYLIAVDTVGAGAGETVLLMDEGNSARQILGAAEAPVRALIVGIVDVVEVAPGEGRAAPSAGAATGRPTRSGAVSKPGPRPAHQAAKAEEPTRRARRRRLA